MFLTIDILNNELVFRYGDFIHLSKNFKKFISFTNFDIFDVKKLHYEPDKNCYSVEYFSKKSVDDIHNYHIELVINNLDKIKKFFEVEYEIDVNDVYFSVGDEIKGRLFDTDWFVVRHLEEKYTGETTSLSEEEFLEVLNYRKKLRKFYNSGVDLDSDAWQNNEIPQHPWEYVSVFK